jgi:hypothetical protein
MQKDYCSVRKKSKTRVAAASTCLSRQASITRQAFFASFLGRLPKMKKVRAAYDFVGFYFL